MSLKKLWAIALVAVLLVVFLLSGCTPSGAGGDWSSAAPSGTDISYAGDTSGQKEPTDRSDAASTAADITEFDGCGAVLVGGLSKNEKNTDKNGEFYLELATPAELGGVSFDRLTLSDAAADGIPKYEYICSVVTVVGRIDVDPSGDVRLFCRAIYYGDRTETPGLSELDIPQGEDMEGGVLTKAEEAKIAPATDGGMYVYSPYTLSSSAVSLGGAELVRTYIAFIDAYLDYKTEIACPSAYCAFMLPQLLEREFPLFGAEVEFDILSAYDAAAGSFCWSYNTSSLAEHEELIKKFTDAANAFLSGAGTALDAESRARVVYNNLTRVCKYDYAIYDDNYTPRYIPSYTAYVDGHLGICSTFARVCVQMMTRAGLECEFCCCDMRGEHTGHAWVQLTIGGSDVFCDPTYELSGSGGLGYIYFGMDYRRRLATDFRIIADTITVGTYSDASA